ncbi:MAG: pyridoxamine 5'-phosphate oxidase family protein [Clostridia bacterium]|nr:pyridoxamine 5'-phosphate oxidase family protein [Clostridia bacterium]
MKEVYEFLKNCGAYYLATVEGDQPRVRPFGTVDLFEDKLYIQTGKVKAVAQQMKANPKVEISAMAQDGRWIRVTAEAVLDDNVKAQEHMLDAYPNLKAMYTAGDGNTEVYYLKNAVAQICSFTDAPREIKF